MAALKQPGLEAKSSPPAESSRAEAGGWIVRLGSFRKPASVSLVVGRARALALPVFTAKFSPGGTKRTMVRAGPFATQAAAEKARGQLADMNLSGHVTPL